jgi:hypothetical protein
VHDEDEAASISATNGMPEADLACHPRCAQVGPSGPRLLIPGEPLVVELISADLAQSDQVVAGGEDVEVHDVRGGSTRMTTFGRSCMVPRWASWSRITAAPPTMRRSAPSLMTASSTTGSLLVS